MKIQYINKKLSLDKLQVIATANSIIEEFQAQGFDLTLRQLYYQFVSRDLIANQMKEYKRLGDIINDGRLVGLIDWSSIVDRTRELVSLAHWDSPRDIVEACAKQFRVDKWDNQEDRVEVWIEKDALVGVIEGVCNDLDVPYFSCRGYTSQSEMWAAAQRLSRHYDNGQRVTIIHLGDHDPSGIDMSRDIQDRLNLFMGSERSVQVNRIALNMNQIEKYSPPPNPAKVTDSRATGYIKKFGRESWELDALDPKVIAKLIRTNVGYFIDDEKLEERIEIENDGKKRLEKAAEKL